LLDYAALAVDFFGLKERVLDHVREHPEPGFGAFVGKVVPVASEFFGSVGVEAAAGALDSL